MTAQLILAILSFLFVFIVFKIIYLDRNPLMMYRFWLLQVAAVGIWFLLKSNLEMMLTIPYVIFGLVILLLFKLFNRRKNPFRMPSFWLAQIIGGIVVTVSIFLFFLCALGEKCSSPDQFIEDIQPETIAGITIVQMKDTIQVENVQYFLSKLSAVEEARGPLKYANKGGYILFARNNGSKDSIRTNGYAYGPYKGQWYRSKENVLQEFINK